MKKIGFLLSIIICSAFLGTKEVKAAPEVVVSKSLQQLVYWDNETQQIYLVCPVSTGIDANSTPVGVFKTSDYYPQWHALFYNQYAYGAIRIYDHILLHSVPYTSKDVYSLDLNEQLKLGTPASHGCIRMSTENIQFLVQTLPRNSRVLIID